jgi:hypothetical protein
MYEITCDDCGRLGFHPSRVAAKSRAETHADDTDHACSVSPMED